MKHTPEILAPAGDQSSALAALAAGADALYLGLKHFSARMQADNFSSKELSRLVDLAHSENRKIYIAFNTLLKPGDLESAGRLIKRVCLGAQPDALIVQDLGVVELVRQTGFTGGVYLSTLANVTHQSAVVAAKALGVDRVILPRELSLEEIRVMDAMCPEGLKYELFIHGALCYCVSGRCWWSSYMGGKSGLRGRCVQPCRRVYKQKGREGRFFSCNDLSLDVLVKNLLELPNVASWKIEGRKKGPHYVYHVTKAYAMLRDNNNDPAARKEAAELLELALGRPGTRARFLPQKDLNPTGNDSQTSSGLLCGKVGKDATGAFILKPRFELLPKDLLRIGVEDEMGHATLPVSRRVPKDAILPLKLAAKNAPRPGTSVFLIDRREPELMQLISQWEDRLQKAKARAEVPETAVTFTPTLPPAAKPARSLDIALRSSLPRGKSGKDGIKPGAVQGLWLSPRTLESISRTLYARISWWLPPVIWPDEEEGWQRLVRNAVRGGARHFVCNEPWQTTLLPADHKALLTAGPFCNTSNAAAVKVLQDMGFSSVILGPELEEEEYLTMPKQCALPLGVVLSGYWPMGITRHSVGPVKSDDTFSSPKGESFWSRRYGQNNWIYPTWPLDLSARRQLLEKAGYSTFVSIFEHPPKTAGEPKRTSEFNWKINML